MMEAVTKMLVFAFLAILCCSQLGSCNLYPITDAEFLTLTPEEVSFYQNRTRYSSDCYVSSKATLRQLMGKLESHEPFRVAEDDWRAFCPRCDAYGIHTMYIPECGMFVAPLPPLPSHAKSGMLYDLKDIEFRNVNVTCHDCSLKTESGQVVKGVISGLWPHPRVSIVAYKRIYDGSLVHFTNSKVVHTKHDKVTMKCHGSKEFQDICNQGQAKHRLEYAIEKTVLEMMPEEIHEAYYKDREGSDIANVFWCNSKKDLSGGSEELTECRDGYVEN